MTKIRLQYGSLDISMQFYLFLSVLPKNKEIKSKCDEELSIHISLCNTVFHVAYSPFLEVRNTSIDKCAYFFFKEKVNTVDFVFIKFCLSGRYFPNQKRNKNDCLNPIEINGSV